VIAAAPQRLQQRARLLAQIRAFFAQRRVLEVETPLLSHAAVTDVHLGSMAVAANGERLWLHTSPELAMKRLLVEGSGPIYQLCRVFRDGERGRRHHPEFTLLEWYRLGFDDRELGHEVDQLLRATLGTPAAEELTYRDVFLAHLGVDPFVDELEVIEQALRLRGHEPPTFDQLDDALGFAMSQVIEPQLGHDRPAIVFDWPPSQAALARCRPGPPPTAARFEVFVRGLELANGFWELADAGEQRQRFEADLAERRLRGLPEPPIDGHFLAALERGLPDCSGVALGVDRLLMLRMGARSIDDVLAFPIELA
jgi:lysyl-tRNA synthetase class 2